MALGSSAPEILLAVIETGTNLGGCPGELGASTIVGSAAFNLLVITAACIYAVDETNDATADGERDPTGPPKGVKKIYDMGVFSVTAGSSIFAYAWLYWVLKDQKVDSVEAWLTFVFFFVLVGLAWGFDRFKERQMQKLKKGSEETNTPTIEYSAVEIYRELIDDKKGLVPATEAGIAKRAKMKEFVKETMNTDQIDKVQLADLKTAVEGEGLIKRIQYRKQVGIQQRKQVVAKGEIYKAEHVSADNIAETEKHPDFGFRCLHYSVSESSGTI
jgi:Ca2+/Na+ antiporter